MRKTNQSQSLGKAKKIPQSMVNYFQESVIVIQQTRILKVKRRNLILSLLPITYPYQKLMYTRRRRRTTTTLPSIDATPLTFCSIHRRRLSLVFLFSRSNEIKVTRLSLSFQKSWKCILSSFNICVTKVLFHFTKTSFQNNTHFFFTFLCYSFF